MTIHRCYQCGDEDLEEIRQRRKEQVRAWADEQIRLSDANLTAGEQFTPDPDEFVTQEIPTDQEVPTEEEAQAALDEPEEDDSVVDATAEAAEEQGDPVKVEEASKPKPAPKAKTPVKK